LIFLNSQFIIVSSDTVEKLSKVNFATNNTITRSGQACLTAIVVAPFMGRI